MKDKFLFIKGNIVNMEVDAIVNSANQHLIAGSGVSGAIFLGAGEKLIEECKRYNGIEIGKGILTDSYDLPCKKIIHILAPKYYLDEVNREVMLKNCYREIIRISNQEKFKSIAIPSIGTGVFKWPFEIATRIAIETLAESLDSSTLEKIYFIFRTDEQLLIFQQLLEEL